MKKMFGVLLVLVVASGVFALDVLKDDTQSLTVEGSVKTGVKFEGHTYGADGEDPTGTFTPYNDDAGKPLRADATFTYKKGSAGLKFILRADVDYNVLKAATGIVTGPFPTPAAPGDPVSLPVSITGTEYAIVYGMPNAWGWFGLLNDMITIYGGKMDDGKWGSNKLDLNYTDTGFDNDNGLKVEIKPISGLSFGFSFFPLLQKIRPDELFNFTTLGATYEMAGLLKLSLAARFDKIEGDFWNYHAAAAQNADIDDAGLGHKYFQLGGGLNFLGVQNLTAGVDVAVESSTINNLNAAGTSIPADKERVNGVFKIGGGAKYQITPAIYGQLKVGYEDTYSTTDNKGTGESHIKIGLEGGYTLNDKLSLNLNFDLDFDGKSNHGQDGFADSASLGKYHGGSVIDVKPKFTADFGNGAKFVTFYKLSAKTGGYADGTSDDLKPKTNMDHTVQLDFIWSF